MVEKWSATAPFWEKHQDLICQMFAPVTEALMEAARIVPGNAVLDVATGAGEPALSVAAAVGRQGRVVGIDLAPEMVAAARRAAEQRELRNAQFEVAFADELPFAGESFDAVVSRFGAMFFPAPVNAVREMLRVLRPGGKLALAVWGLEESNPFFYTLQRIVDRYVETAPPEPDGPDAFRFASLGKLRGVLSEAGAEGTAERLLKFPIRAGASVEEYWTMRREMSEKLREKFGKLSEAQAVEVSKEALEALRAYDTGSGMSVPAEALIVSGTKPG